MHLVQRIGRHFGYRRLTFVLDRVSTGRLAWVSVLPLAVIVALCVRLLASYQFGGLDDDTVWDDAFWIGDISIRAGVPLSLAASFVAGMQKSTRAAGSWALVIGLSLMLASAGLGVASVTLVLARGLPGAFELRVQLWTEWSASLAFLAVGYFFVAYRTGLNRRPRRRFVRRRYSALS